MGSAAADGPLGGAGAAPPGLAKERSPAGAQEQWAGAEVAGAVAQAVQAAAEGVVAPKDQAKSKAVLEAERWVAAKSRVMADLEEALQTARLGSAAKSSG